MGLLDFLSLNKNAPDLTPAYTAIMAQARKPDHYGAGGVPDSFDGRFDMLAIHVHLVLRRLRSEGVARDDIGQALFDMFFRDMDQAMREAGVGDLGVGKKIRKMAQAFMAAPPLMMRQWEKRHLLRPIPKRQMPCRLCCSAIFILMAMTHSAAIS